MGDVLSNAHTTDQQARRDQRNFGNSLIYDGFTRLEKNRANRRSQTIRSCCIRSGTGVICFDTQDAKQRETSY